jgi:fructose-bisphosphate aldolase class I
MRISQCLLVSFVSPLGACESSSTLLADTPLMMDKIINADGFIAALDQSGGSTPRALQLYGFPEELFKEADASMYEAVHQMRSRIVSSPSFHGSRVLGAILFEDTMNRKINDKPTATYLWEEKRVVPFLKIDKGLLPEENGVQLMKSIPDLDNLLRRAKDNGIFGTKMRSFIQKHNPFGIEAIVDQQFRVGRQILRAGLVPILEPEVNIDSPDKMECEETLKAVILKHLDQLGESEKIILKLSLPSRENFYQECVEHPRCLRVVALSGGYSRDEANEILGKQQRMIASFSRALTEGLTHSLSDEDFDRILDDSIASIFAASKKSQ